MKWMFSKLKQIFGSKRPSEDDMAKNDEDLLADPSLSPMDKLSTAFMQFHRTTMNERHEERIWKRRRNIALIIFAISGTVTSVVYNANKITKNIPSKDFIAVVNITGAIGQDRTSQHGAINDALKKAFEEPRAKRVILRVDSPGGRPNDSEAVINEMLRLKKLHNKPVDAVVENIGASAAYMIAVHADTLYMGRYSMVGSVGAMMDTWNLGRIVEKVEAERLTFVSGQYKDLLNPYRKIREDERAKVQSMVDGLAAVFADEVIERRKGKLTLSRAELTTGEVWIGDAAVKLGLADKIGTVNDVAALHELEVRNVGPHEDRGFFIPRMSAYFEDMGSAIRESFMKGMVGERGLVVN